MISIVMRILLYCAGKYKTRGLKSADRVCEFHYLKAFRILNHIILSNAFLQLHRLTLL